MFPNLEEFLKSPMGQLVLMIVINMLMARMPWLGDLLRKILGVPTPTPTPIVKNIKDETTNDLGTSQPQVVYVTSGGILPDNIKQMLPLIIMGIVIFVVMSKGGGCTPQPTPTPAPSVAKPATGDTGKITAPTPSAELQALVAPVKSLAATNPAAAKAWAALYLAGADVIRRDSTRLASPGAARTAKIVADELFLQKTPNVGVIPGMSERTNQVLSQYVGTADKPMTDSDRRRLAESFEAIAWALGG